MAQLDRTLPPNRNTTGTTTVAYGGMSPIDGYRTKIDRPLIYLETTCTAAVSTATASIPALYVNATLTSGMSGNISATAAHFITHADGTSVGKIAGVASFVQVDTGFTAFTESGGLSSNAIITPLSVGIRCHSTGTLTLAGSMGVFGIHAQWLAGSGTTAPTFLFFARVNTTTAPTALFYFDSSGAAGYVAANTHQTEALQIPLAYVHGIGDTYEKALYVKLYHTP